MLPLAQVPTLVRMQPWQITRTVLLVQPSLCYAPWASGQTILLEPVRVAELDTRLTMRGKVLVLARRWRVFVMQAMVELRVTIL